MNYLSKLLAFLSQVPNGNVPNPDLFIDIHRGLKEANDKGLIKREDITSAQLASPRKGYAIVEQSFIDALEKENKQLRSSLVKVSDDRARLKKELDEACGVG